MHSYEVRQSHLMPADAAAYRPFFFHTRDFVLRNGSSDSTYTLIVYMEGEVFVRIHFTLTGTTAISLPQSSFGGFDIHPDCSPEDIKYAISAMQEFCAEKHIHAFEITMYPYCYDTFSATLVHDALVQSGAGVKYSDTAQYITIAREPFDTLVDPDERRHLNYSRKHQWSFWQEGEAMLADAYALIASSRERKGYPVTLTFDELSRAFARFPDRYLLFSIRNIDGTMLAASVCIHVNENVLYDFYHGDNADYRKHSPVVPLIEGLYMYAKTHGYSLLDLGTSTEKGIRNESLFDFKKHLGAASADKKTYAG